MRNNLAEFNLLRILPGLMIQNGDAYMYVSDDSKNIFIEFNELDKYSHISKHKPTCFCINNLHTKKEHVDKFLDKYFS